MSDGPRDPAFPSGEYTDGFQEDGTPINYSVHGGVSIRDYFLVHVLQGLLAGAGGPDAIGSGRKAPDVLVRKANLVVDAILEDRNERL